MESSNDEARLLVEVDDGVGWITLVNPTRANALTRDMALGLADAWQALDQDPQVRMLAITGAGERHFCAGADLRALESPGGLIAPGERPGLTNLPCGVRKPVVAVVNGPAIGIGLSFVADADLVVASKNAWFSDPHIGIGRIVSYASLALSTKLPANVAAAVGLGTTKLSAERAHQFGVVNTLVEAPADLPGAVKELADVFRTASPTALIESLALLRAMGRRGTETVFEESRAVLERFHDHPDGTEGPRARGEGRAPVWQEV